MNDQRSLSDQLLDLRKMGLDAGMYDAVDFLVNADHKRRALEEVAAYFADVLAASAYGLLSVKATSKAERRRQLSICRNAALCLNARALVNQRASETPRVLARLEDIITQFGQEAAAGQ